VAEAAPRRTQEQRSSETRTRLARAAFEQIDEFGYAQFRTAAVAKSAGVSQGGQLHHFPTKEDLAFAAIEYAYEQVAEHTQAHFDRFDAATPNSVDALRAIVADSMDFYFSSAFEVGVDVVKGASGNPDLRRRIADVSRRNRDFAERGWLARLVAHGWSPSDAQDIIDLTTSLVRGFAIRKWIQRDSGQFDRLLDRWVEIIHAALPATRTKPGADA
jgi:AcrR family transcriptional regulator